MIFLRRNISLPERCGGYHHRPGNYSILRTLSYVQRWLGIDDTLQVWRAHGVGGLTGAILIGALASSSINKVEAGWHQIGVQTLAVVIVAVFAWVVTTIILKIIDSAGKLRVSEEVQVAGLDTVDGEHAYNLWGMSNNANDTRQ